MLARSRRPATRSADRSQPSIRLGPSIRRVLAHHPWIRWTVVIGLASSAGALAWAMLDQVDRARASWTDTRTVLVADGDHSPGDLLATRSIPLPVAAVPPDAIRAADLADGVRATQRLADGETVVALDIARSGGPAGLAPSGTVVVAVADPLVPNAPVGAAVAIYAEGLVLAAEARVVAIDGGAVLVAVAATDAPLVAAAARNLTASLAFVAD